MLDITAIILTYNEEVHIRRCLENVKQFAKRIIIVDCFSKDKTCEIAKEMGAEVIQHEWPGNQAEQFNWLIDNVSINTNGFSDSMPMSISCLISLQNSMKSSRQWMRAFQPSLSLSRALIAEKYFIMVL